MTVRPAPAPTAAPPADDLQALADAPLAEVVRHLLARYHRPLETELPRLVALAEKVQAHHGDSDPARFGGIRDTLRALQQSLLDHMLKEEQILFPLISTGQGAEAGLPIRVMEMEHEEATELMARLRALTAELPGDACKGVRELWAGVAALDSDLQAHMRLEDEVLFPRALSAAP